MELFYLKMPFFIKNIMVSLFGLKLKFNRNKIKEIESINNTSELNEYHKKKIKDLFINAVDSPFYSGAFESYNIDIDSNDILGELKKLPILDKNMVLSNKNEIEIKKKDSFTLKTSGTTGSGLVFKSTRYAESTMWSYFARFRRRIGINERDMWCGYFCGKTIKLSQDVKSPHWVFNYFGKQILFSNYHLNCNSIKSYVDCLNKYQPDWIHGYPSFLYLLSSLAVEYNLKLMYKPKFITFGSESVQSKHKKVIQSFFDAPSFDLYCQTEGVAMFSECEFGKMHVDEEFSYVEFIETNQENKFEVVGTSLFNHAFPFIRYRTGDIIELDFCKCECGLNSRVIKNIDGRKEDYIELKNGSKVGRLDHIFKSMENIVEAQIKQFKNKEVEFNIVKGSNYTENDEKMLHKEIASRLSDNIDYRIIYSDNISRTKSGKLRFVIKE